MYVRKIMLRVPSGVIRLIDFDARGDVRVVELGGLAYVVLHVFGDLVARIDGLHRALWHAHGAVYALGRVDHELVIGVVDAVHRARPYASRVLRADTQFGNNIGHALPLCSVGRLLHTSIMPARSLPPTRAALRVGKRSVKDIRFSGLIHRSAWRGCMKSGSRVVIRYSSTHEKALPDGFIRCRMELYRTSLARTQGIWAAQNPQPARDPKRRLLPTEEWLPMAPAPSRFPQMANRLPLLQDLAHRWHLGEDQPGHPRTVARPAEKGSSAQRGRGG